MLPSRLHVNGPHNMQKHSGNVVTFDPTIIIQNVSSIGLLAARRNKLWSFSHLANTSSATSSAASGGQRMGVGFYVLTMERIDIFHTA